MARLRDSWCTSLTAPQQPRNPERASIARDPYETAQRPGLRWRLLPAAGRLRSSAPYAASAPSTTLKLTPSSRARLLSLFRTPVSEAAACDSAASWSSPPYVARRPSWLALRVTSTVGPNLVPADFRCSLAPLAPVGLCRPLV